MDGAPKGVVLLAHARIVIGDGKSYLTPQFPNVGRTDILSRIFRNLASNIGCVDPINCLASQLHFPLEIEL
jgi:hypothetical protein